MGFNLFIERKMPRRGRDQGRNAGQPTITLDTAIEIIVLMYSTPRIGRPLVTEMYDNKVAIEFAGRICFSSHGIFIGESDWPMYIYHFKPLDSADIAFFTKLVRAFVKMYPGTATPEVEQAIELARTRAA